MTLVGRSWRDAVLGSGRDSFVRYHLAPAAVREVHVGAGWWAVGFSATSYFSDGGLLVGGDVDRVGDIVGDLCVRLSPPQVTVDARVPLPFADPAKGSEWAWLHVARALPAVPGQERVRWSPDPIAVAQLLSEANPDAFVGADDPAVKAWAAIPGEDGRLVACGAVTHHSPGIPHLGSITVSPAARRQGLGAALTAAMVRRLLRTAPVVSLALWSGNTVARALYDRLGFTGGHDYATRELT